MNPSKIEQVHDHDLFHRHHLLDRPILDDESQPSIPDPFLLFRSSSPSSDSSSNAAVSHIPPPCHVTPDPDPDPDPVIDPDPHLSTQFYTFNSDSHSLMIRCILEARPATPDEIRAATPPPVLATWRSVWKDRNTDTAYLTAWKRIQDKLTVHVATHGTPFLCFKNNSSQFVSHFNQWQEIVTRVHAEGGDTGHLGLRETLERIKQVWTVGAKFYGIPESFIRVCVEQCRVCSDSSGMNLKSKRRRFEYTESVEVPAKDVPRKLQQLAVKHKVVLCIRQKYIRYKPFLAEVKDYACHRAGDPTSAKRPKVVKREPYASKRCGCGFRIRAIVPIKDYNEKDKSFVYQEEGMAVFKLYAVHSGHEPGPSDGNARIMHRMVGNKGGFLMDEDTVYGISEEMENEGYGGDLRSSVLQQVHELKNVVGSLEGKVGKLPPELLGSVSQELFEVVNKLRTIGDSSSKPVDFLSEKLHTDDVLVAEGDLGDWGDHRQLIEEDEDSFGNTLGEVATWDQIGRECRSEKDLMADTCKTDKWLKCAGFDQKSILDCEDSKLAKPMRHDDNVVVSDVDLVGAQVDSFYPDHKWYDSPCLDPTTDCCDSGFKHGNFV